MIEKVLQIKRFKTPEIYIGFVIAFLLWSWLRLLGSIGPGEIFLVLVTYFLLIVLLINLKRFHLLNIGDFYALWMFFYFCFVILLMTLINYGRIGAHLF